MAPAGKATVCVSVKKAGGLASIWERENPSPESARRSEASESEFKIGAHIEERSQDSLPLVTTPVVKGPLRQPYEVRRPNSSMGESEVGLGKAIRGGPARPNTASCCAAELAKSARARCEEDEGCAYDVSSGVGGRLVVSGDFDSDGVADDLL